MTISGQVQPGGSGADNPADVTLEIGDDEAIEPVVVENVRVRTRETLAVVTWDAVDGATGYTVEWTSRVSRGVASWGRVSSMDVGRHLGHRATAGSGHRLRFPRQRLQHGQQAPQTPW